MQKIARGGTPPSFPAKKAESTRAKKRATGLEAKLGPKTKQVRKRSVEEDDEEYRGPTGSKKTSPNVMRDVVTSEEPVNKVDEEGREWTGGTIFP